MKTSPFHGLLVLDKPGGITSRAAVNRAQGWFPRATRLGHTGTLDPLATGVLVLCLGSATRLTVFVQRMAKTYRTRLLLGARSNTDDADGVITPVEGARAPARAQIEAALCGLLGEIEQVPPAYSAARVTARRAYDLARSGEEFHLGPRRVSIYGIDLLGYAYPHVELEVRCGKGTYIRSLARDLGERLGCGALVETLRRTRVGPFAVAGALSLDAGAEEAGRRLLPVAAAVAELPRVIISAEQARRLRQGQGIPLQGVTAPARLHADEPEVAVYTGEDTLAAVGVLDYARQLLLPTKVLPA
jgi:tRNA pseudouridine55 synthase